MEESLQQYLKQQFDTDLDTCSDWQLYSALQNLVLETIQQKKKEPNQEQDGRRLYYVSAEFLIGRLLGNNRSIWGFTARRSSCWPGTDTRCPTWKNWSRNPLWATAVWEGWRSASSIRLRRWA